jgi:WD40 repeat protein
MCHRQIAPELVQRLLNDVANDQDQLPVLQHAMMRCWKLAVQRHLDVIDNTLYEYVGGPNALDVHAEKIYSQLGKEENGKMKQQIVALLFKRITKRATEQEHELSQTDGMRDPALLKTITSQTGFARSDLVPVIDAFRKRARAFLRPGDETRDLSDESMIDITHESLIRKWKQLGDWVRDESNSADLYMQLCNEASKAKRGDFLSQSRLDLYNAWLETAGPNAKWAQRYSGDYSKAIKYLSSSRRHWKWQKWWRWSAVTGAIAGLAILYFVWARAQADKHLILEFDGLSKLVTREDVSTSWRVPTAIRLAAAAESRSNELRQTFLQEVHLNQWELFSALRSGKKLNEKAPDRRVESSCGVAVDPSKKFVALADGKTVKVWQLSKIRDSVTPFAYSEPFPGVDCVRFGTGSNNLRLLASSYSYETSQQSASGQSQVMVFDINEVSPMKGSRQHSIAAPIGTSFVDGGEEFAVLTSHDLTIYNPAGEHLVSLDGGSVQGGFFDSRGAYVVISYQDGRARVYSLEDAKPSAKLEFGADNRSLPGWPKQTKRPQQPDDALQTAVFSSDSTQIVTGSRYGVVDIQGNPFVNKNSYNTIAIMPGTISALALEKHGSKTLIAAGTVTGEAAVFQETDPGMGSSTSGLSQVNARPGYEGTRFVHNGAVMAIDFANHGADLVTASEDEKARVFEVASGIETTRIPHDSAVVSAMEVGTNGTDDILISASQDGNLQVTDLAAEPPTVLRKWQPEKICIPEVAASRHNGVWPSFVSTQGKWSRTCGQQLEVVDIPESFARDKSLPAKPLAFGDLINESVKFSQDGSSVGWLDSKLEIHYAHCCDNDMSWITPKVGHGSCTDVVSMERTSEPCPLNSPSPPILALSHDGGFVGVSFGTKDGDSVIEVYKVENQLQPNLERIGEGIRTNQPSNTDARLMPYGIEIIKKQILALAVNPGGAVAAGTADGSVFRFDRVQDGWKTRRIVIPQEAGDVLGPQGRVITAVHFSKDIESQLIVARGDSSIWLFSGSGDLLYPPKGKPDPLGDAPAKMFVLSGDGKQIAAVAGNLATFFTVEPNGLTKGLTLQEPGGIQSVAFADQDVVFTSVAVGGSLEKIKHNINIQRQERWLCDKQPSGQNPDSDEEKGCKELRGLSIWPKNSCFWPDDNRPVCGGAGRK